MKPENLELAVDFRSKIQFIDEQTKNIQQSLAKGCAIASICVPDSLFNKIIQCFESEREIIIHKVKEL